MTEAPEIEVALFIENVSLAGWDDYSYRAEDGNVRIIRMPIISTRRFEEDVSLRYGDWTIVWGVDPPLLTSQFSDGRRSDEYLLLALRAAKDQ